MPRYDIIKNAVADRLPIILLITLLLSSVFPVKAQDKVKHCKAIVRANRHKTITFLEMHTDDSIIRFNDPYGVTVTQYNYDSVTVEKEGILTSFRIKQRDVITPCIIYYKNGAKFLDSLNPLRNGHINNYFGFYRSSHVFMTQNFAENSKLYYNQRGNDSVLKTWYGTDILRKMVWYGNGFDSVTMDWNDKGILRYKKTFTGTTQYTSDGIIQSSALDTVIGKHQIICRKEYYSNGVIKSVEYFQDTLPCHTWEYYTAQGVLAKRINKTPVSSLSDNQVAVAAPAPPEIFTYVEQLAEYPGGIRAFEKYLNEHLPDALCRCKKALKGKYDIRLNISENGQVSVLDIKGQNATDFKQVFPALAQWRPAKMNGRAISQVCIVSVVVK